MNDRIWYIVSKWGFRKIDNSKYNFCLEKGNLYFFFESDMNNQQLVFTVQHLEKGIKRQYRRIEKFDKMERIPDESLKLILKDFIIYGVEKIFKFVIFGEKE